MSCTHPQKDGRGCRTVEPTPSALEENKRGPQYESRSSSSLSEGNSDNDMSPAPLNLIHKQLASGIVFESNRKLREQLHPDIQSSSESDSERVSTTASKSTAKLEPSADTGKAFQNLTDLSKSTIFSSKYRETNGRGVKGNRPRSNAFSESKGKNMKNYTTNSTSPPVKTTNRLEIEKQKSPGRLLEGSHGHTVRSIDQSNATPTKSSTTVSSSKPKDTQNLPKSYEISEPIPYSKNKSKEDSTNATLSKDLKAMSISATSVAPPAACTGVPNTAGESADQVQAQGLKSPVEPCAAVKGKAKVHWKTHSNTDSSAVAPPTNYSRPLSLSPQPQNKVEVNPLLSRSSTTPPPSPNPETQTKEDSQPQTQQQPHNSTWLFTAKNFLTTPPKAVSDWLFGSSSTPSKPKDSPDTKETTTSASIKTNTSKSNHGLETILEETEPLQKDWIVVGTSEKGMAENLMVSLKEEEKK
ncbi:hypothetical protein ONS95_000055 [Cadophora gregata]|uniref:uncharacterized protein n=1 Tax=Cadophora gregata TaxID=51156 RepID=UPI0026DD44A6|nr:uncharacterized protein ONS95_000055 [Cadophora gregata]KAK0115677.1 hypothetical protein ONS96_014123 [Cadophora gregata f. sp. sojae]KAK0128071.1 hypothetical protein ONS95_000055 [Cadophora gregata]